MSTKSRKTREIAADDQADPRSAIPWSEWTDAELNAEKWDLPKNGNDGHFVDPEPRVIPPSLDEPHEWRRVTALKNLSSIPVVFTSSNAYPDFAKNNKHILHSEFVRWFISTIINLQCALREGLQVEEKSPNFIWLGDSDPWKGWMYVYSMNKAGNAAPHHRPVVNPNGKYVVRLFFMGFWRRFVVDDMIPLDKDGKPLLPRTENDSELWPMLLAKAMMKLAALSWTNRREINDFYPVSCFTGWICLSLVTKSLSWTEKWNLLTGYTEREGETEVPAGKPSTVKPTGKGNIDKKKIKKRDNFSLSPLRQNPGPSVVIFANFVNATEPAAESIPGITPCWSHPVYVSKLKDINVDTSQMRWKLYRWFDWASRQRDVNGVGNVPGPAVRSLKLISPLRRWSNDDNATEAAGKEEYVEEARPPLPRNEISKGSSARDDATTVEEPDIVVPLPDIGVWADFSKVSPYLDEILIFYKPSDFEYHTRVSDLLRTSADGQMQVSATGSRVGSQATGSKEGKKVQAAKAPPSFQGSFKWQRNVSDCGNDPLYMLIDSIDEKFVLIEYCSMPQPSPASTRSYFIVERHDFFEKSANEDAAALITTFSSGATIFEAGPGRHVYRMLFRPESSYFVRIVSDTIFYIGDRFKMHDLMSLESERVDAIVRNISNRIGAAFQEFGRPGYASQLRTFYDSYMPRESDKLRSNANEKLIKNIHRLFIEELTVLIGETFSTSETTAILHALRVFFIDPVIGFQRREVKHFDQLKPEFSIYESAAIEIQSFFRMILIKMQKALHDPSHPRHSEVTQSLRKVAELFDYTRRESAAHSMIRKIITNDIIYTSLYPCHEDFPRVLKVEEWKGVVRNVQPGQWVPVIRVVLNAPTARESVYAGIDLVTNLPRYIIRVFNNETCREIRRFVNKVATDHYPHAKRGYTVIGYGWSDGYKFKEVDWCLRVTTIKGEPTFRRTTVSGCLLSSAKPPSLTIHELSNNYVPNVSNIIGKWIVTITTDSLLSFRLSTSYNKVETVIKIVDRDGNVFDEAKGGSVIILPSVCLPFLEKPTGLQGSGDALESRSRSKSLLLDSGRDFDEATTEYHVQAYVANDSWPLTRSEWRAVNEAKSRGTVNDPNYGKTSVSSLPKRGTRTRVSGRSSEDRLHGQGETTMDGTLPTIFQRPLCGLQIVTDVGTKVQIEHDRRREDEIAGMKRLWEDEEPGRLIRGRDLRDEFLKERSNSESMFARISAGSAKASPDPTVRSTEIRSSKPPPNPSRVLSARNIAAYIAQDDDDDDDEEERWVKTEGDEEMLRNQRAINSLDFDQEQLTYLDEEAGLAHDQRQRYRNLFDSYVRKVAEWKNLDDAASEKRESYLAVVKAAAPSSRASKTVQDGDKNKIRKKKKKDK